MWLNCKYGEHAEVTPTRGEEHEPLGMKFMLRNGEFILDVAGKVKQILEEFPMKFKNDKSEKMKTPAA